MPLSALLSLENDISAKRYVSRSGFCGYCQFNRSLSDHVVKHFSHLSRGKKATTQNQVQHTSGVLGEYRFVDWTCFTTDIDRGWREQNPRCRTILRLGEAIPNSIVSIWLVLVQSPYFNQHWSLYCHQTSLEISGDCYRTPCKTSCCTCMGHYSVFNNSRLRFNLYTEWFREIVLGLS